MFSNRKILSLVGAGLIALSIAGCASEPRQVGEENSITSMDIDIQNFNNAAKDITNQMLLAPRVQQAMAASAQQNNGKLPLIKISRIQNDTSLKVNLVTYLVTPIQQVFVNSGRVDFISDDKTGQDVTAANEALGNSSPRLPDFVLFGSVSQLDTGTHRTDQTTYVFHIQLTDTVTNSVIFIGDKQVLKQQDR